MRLPSLKNSTDARISSNIRVEYRIRQIRKLTPILRVGLRSLSAATSLGEKREKGSGD